MSGSAVTSVNNSLVDLWDDERLEWKGIKKLNW